MHNIWNLHVSRIVIAKHYLRVQFGCGINKVKMAAKMWKTCVRGVFHLNVRQPFQIPVRNSKYSAIYLEPTLDTEELHKGLDEEDPRNFQPIKAATPEQTTSLNYDPLIAKFIRQLIREGNKERALFIVNRTFEVMKLIQLEKFHKAKDDLQRQQVELDVRKIFHQAVENCKPLLVTEKIAKGGVLYTVPVPVRPRYAVYKSMQWLIDSGSEKDDEVRVWDRLSYELIDAANNEGKAIRKKHDMHRICEANRAYAHFRW